MNLLKTALTFFLILIFNYIKGQNLVINGNFNLGNTGFSTDYTYCNTANCLNTLPNNGYSVGPSAAAFHWAYTAVEHTAGSSSMMIVNGGQPTLNVWTQTIAVVPMQTYTFSAWICSLYATNIAQLEFYVNGVSTGTVNANSVINIWDKANFSWNSGASTSAVLLIKDINSTSIGNDFGLDDIVFHTSKVNSIYENISGTIKLFPNPTNDYIIIKSFEEINFNFEIIDMFGQVVVKNKLLINNNIDVSFLNKGTYILRGNLNNIVITEKFIKN